MPRRETETEGFSLIELLVVIAVISLLAALLLPVLKRVRVEAKVARAKVELHQISLAVEMYCGPTLT